ncbi:hypothetical protein [Niabella terrae]
MKMKIAFSMIVAATMSIVGAQAQSRYVPKPSVHISIGINQPPVYYAPRPVAVYPVRYASRPYYSGYRHNRYHRSRHHYQSQYMPHGHAKKYYKYKSVKGSHSGHYKYKKHRR